MKKEEGGELMPEEKKAQDITSTYQAELQKLLLKFSVLQVNFAEFTESLQKVLMLADQIIREKQLSSQVQQ